MNRAVRCTTPKSSHLQLNIPRRYEKSHGNHDKGEDIKNMWHDSGELACMLDCSLYIGMSALLLLHPLYIRLYLFESKLLRGGFAGQKLW
jgi:hypothetical protein